MSGAVIIDLDGPAGVRVSVEPPREGYAPRHFAAGISAGVQAQLWSDELGLPIEDRTLSGNLHRQSQQS